MKTRIGSIFIAFLLVLPVFSQDNLAMNKSINDLYQDALYRESSIGDLEGAIDLYREIVERHSRDREISAKALLRLGICYQTMGKTPDALKSFQAVISDFSGQTTQVNTARAFLSSAGGQAGLIRQRDSQELMDAYLLGKFAYDEGDFNLCVNSIKKVLELKPSDRDTEIMAREILAGAYDALGRDEEAEKERRVIWEMGEKVWLPGKTRAENYLQAELSRKNPYLRKQFLGPTLRGTAAFRMGDYGDAVGYFNKAVSSAALAPPSLRYRTYVIFGWVCRKKDLDARSEDAFKKAVSLFLREGPGYFGELDPYIFLAHHPKYPRSEAWPYFEQGDELRASGKYPAAVIALEQAIRLSDQYPWMKIYLTYLKGLCLFREGEQEKAAAALEELKKQVTSRKEVNPALVDILEPFLDEGVFSNNVAWELYCTGNFELEEERYLLSIKTLSASLVYSRTPALTAWIRLALARVYREQGKDKLVRKEYARIQELRKMAGKWPPELIRLIAERIEEPELYVSRAYKLFEKGKISYQGADYTKAREYFLKALAENPVQPWLKAWIHVWLANISIVVDMGRPGPSPEEPEGYPGYEGGNFHYVLELAEKIPEPHDPRLKEAVKAAEIEGWGVSAAYFKWLEAERMLAEGGDPAEIEALLNSIKEGIYWIGPLITLDHALIIAAKGDRMESREIRKCAFEIFESFNRGMKANPILLQGLVQGIYPNFFFSESGDSYRKGLAAFYQGNSGAAGRIFQKVFDESKEYPAVRGGAALILAEVAEEGDQAGLAAEYLSEILRLEDNKNQELIGFLRAEAGTRLNRARIAGEKVILGDDKVISWKKAADYLGEIKRIKGCFHNTFSDPEEMVLLSFAPEPKPPEEGKEPMEEYPPEDFPMVIIYKPDLDKFPDDPVEFYRGKTVIVTGLIDILGFQLRVRVKDPSQISIIEENKDGKS
jgi:tetratricopeptide (TPR) repeat protein